MTADVDVLIGQAYFLRFDPSLWSAGRPYPPLGALYAAAWVRQTGMRVALFDAMLAASEDEWIEALEQKRPRFAVLYEDSFNYLSKMCLLRMRDAAMRMIAAASQRHIPTVVCGSDATDHPDRYLAAGAYAVIAGEGEVTLVEVLRALANGSRDLSGIPGVIVEGETGLERAPVRTVIRDLDALPRPAWDLVDIERYRRIWVERHGLFSLNISTTRGCPYHCNWCAKPIYGQRYTARSPRSVADEIAWMRQALRPDHLWITDDIFGLKPGWIEAFARELVARDAVVPFKCLMRADNVDAEVVAALRRAGCRTVWLGAESGSQRILDAMEKGATVEDIAQAAGLLHDAGIEVGFFLQFGYPGETLDDIRQTIALVERCRPEDIGISVSYPLPGTPFHERVRAELGATQNWTDSADLRVMYRATYPPAFYRVLHDYVHARFRLRHALTRRSLRPPENGGGARRGAVAKVKTVVREAARLPILEWRLRRLAGHDRAGGATSVPRPLLSPQAAAVPSEQQP